MIENRLFCFLLHSHVELTTSSPIYRPIRSPNYSANYGARPSAPSVIPLMEYITGNMMETGDDDDDDDDQAQ